MWLWHLADFTWKRGKEFPMIPLCHSGGVRLPPIKGVLASLALPALVLSLCPVLSCPHLCSPWLQEDKGTGNNWDSLTFLSCSQWPSPSLPCSQWNSLLPQSAQGARGSTWGSAGLWHLRKCTCVERRRVWNPFSILGGDSFLHSSAHATGWKSPRTMTRPGPPALWCFLCITKGANGISPHHFCALDMGNLHKLFCSCGPKDEALATV